ncbi:MAG: GNAT family N-acetyltransferase [Burkholderiales bacterium]|nr:GNAT family N-acetyltransferase [Burkholderiales bacterium]
MSAPPLPAGFRLQEGPWERLAPGARAVRQTVFVDEQAIAPALEWDDRDAIATHVLVTGADGAPCATGRLYAEAAPRVARIGRLAVCRPWRGIGLGAAVLAHLVERARRDGHAEAVLHAQSHARGFYAGRGFAVEGAEFIEDGIAHLRMRKALAGCR